MRLILGATRADTKNVRAANSRVYLKPACQANRPAGKMLGVRRFYQGKGGAAVDRLLRDSLRTVGSLSAFRMSGG
jgi:hypothetical protein